PHRPDNYADHALGRRYSARLALRLLLEDHGLTYVIKDDVLQITTKEVADKTLEARVYDVHDLLSFNDDGVPDFDSLIEVLKSTIAASSWDDTGGLGQAAPFGNSLAVSQTGKIQEQVAALFTALRRAQAQIKIGDTSPAGPFGVSETETTIRGVLTGKI